MPPKTISGEATGLSTVSFHHRMRIVLPAVAGVFGSEAPSSPDVLPPVKVYFGHALFMAKNVYVQALHEQCRTGLVGTALEATRANAETAA